MLDNAFLATIEYCRNCQAYHLLVTLTDLGFELLMSEGLVDLPLKFRGFSSATLCLVVDDSMEAGRQPSTEDVMAEMLGVSPVCIVARVSYEDRCAIYDTGTVSLDFEYELSLSRASTKWSKVGTIQLTRRGHAEVELTHERR